MKVSKIIRVCTLMYFGFIVAYVGYSFHTWQFYAITIPVSIGWAISEAFRDQSR